MKVDDRQERRFARRSMAWPAFAQVNLGQMVTAGQPHRRVAGDRSASLSISRLPQQQLGEVREGLTVKVTTDAIPGREFEGKLTAINSTIDPVTRNVTLAGHAREPGSRFDAPECSRRSKCLAAAKESDALHSSDRGFLRALRRFGLRDREKAGREDAARNR